VTYTWTTCAGGHIFPTATACCNYINPVGLYELENVCYNAIDGQVTNAIPGVFFYYTYLTAPAANFTINIIQTKDCTTFKYFELHQGNQIKLYTDECVKINSVTPSYNSSTGIATLVVTGAVPGNEYVLSAKYNAKSIIGSTFGTCGTNPSVIYTFVSQTVVGSNSPVSVPDSEGNVTAVANCTDNTPLPPSCTKSEPIAPVPASPDITLNSYPNPFSTSTNINFSVPVSGQVQISVYTLMGARVATLFDDYVEADQDYTVEFKGEGHLNQATYICVINTKIGTKYQRILMIR
jgi:hypothetical protein